MFNVSYKYMQNFCSLNKENYVPVSYGSYIRFSWLHLCVETHGAAHSIHTFVHVYQNNFLNF